ncbi:DUF3817 domain-containing protein [uncultured Flavobacterium sp.]|uniref:DUF3817 domain-containing protein n=1 Tax=uncultured Flavobacterium sp. TaxID=165435 RepID=UPI0030CA24B0
MKIFKITAFLEGFSYLFLLANMLIIKYLYNDLYHLILKPLGMAHGFLFVTYIAFALYYFIKKKFNVGIFLRICVASLIPFATFKIESIYLKNENL